MAAANLPLELFYKIALHLPSTSDVLTFTLTHSRIREVLSTPGLFKDRLALQGWDVSAWLGEDGNAAVSRSPQGNLERWMHIDYIYCRTVQLFDEAAADDYFSESPPDSDVDSDCHVREPEFEQPDQGLFNDTVTPQFTTHRTVPLTHSLDRQKTIVWLRKLSEVLPVFLTHHRGENVSRITEERHRGALATYATVLISICSSVIPNDILSSVSGLQPSKPTLSTSESWSEYAWLEPSCFSFAALLIQCDTNTVRSICGNPEVYTDSPFPVFRSFWEADYVHSHFANLDPYSHPIAIAKIRQLRVSEHYFSTFLIQAMISMMLHWHSDPSLPLRAPSLPYINPAASFSYDELFGLQHEYPTRDLSSFYPLPPPRPWLRNRLAGTPLAELSSSANSEGDANDGGCRRRMWAGYCTVQGDETAGPPMFLELYSVKGPIGRLPLPGLEPDLLERIDFRGEGQDGVGAFTLSGFCNIRTGVVMATKAYTTHEWKWRGMVTPSGMAGISGFGPYTGWWWIWPREWSDYPATTESDCIASEPYGPESLV